MYGESIGANGQRLVNVRPQHQEWYALHARCRHEKLVAAQLRARGVPHWLPLIERQRSWSDRHSKILFPLFPGYLFVNVAYDERIYALRARGVARIVSFNGKPCPVPPEQIEAIRTALVSRLQCDPYPSLAVGEEAEVLRGPLKGYRGVVIEEHKRHRVLLSVPLIGQSVAVEIDAMDLDRV